MVEEISEYDSDAVQCPLCGRMLPSTDINTSSGVAVCTQCTIEDSEDEEK